MTRTFKRLVLGLVTFASLFAFALTPAASAAVTPKIFAGTTNAATTTNGVSGYFADNGFTGDSYRTLFFKATTTVTSENWVPGTDGGGGQICNANTGRAAGTGLERNPNGTFRALFGLGILTADPNSTDPFNPCFGGILPTASIHAFGGALAAVPDLATVTFSIRVLHSHWKHERILYCAEQTNPLIVHTYCDVLKMPAWVRLYATQAGSGMQKSAACLSAPALSGNAAITFDDVFANGFGNPLGSGFSTYQEVNSAANGNANGGVDPNPFAQLDPLNSGGVASTLTTGSWSVFEGNVTTC